MMRSLDKTWRSNHLVGLRQVPTKSLGGLGWPALTFVESRHETHSAELNFQDCTRAGDGNRTRVLSLGSEPVRLQILAYGPESLRFQESSDSR